MGSPSEPAYDDLDPATIAVRELIAASRKMTERMARQLGMGLTDMSALGELVQHGELGATQIAERLGIRTASATVLIDRLERAGHAERVRDTVDRRRVTVTATPAARATSYQAWSTIVYAINGVSAALPDADRRVVESFLAEVTAVIESSAR